MTAIAFACRWGTPTGPRSIYRDAECRTPADVERVAREMIAESGDDRAFVIHFPHDRAFPGYRKMPREFYGPGLSDR